MFAHTMEPTPNPAELHRLRRWCLLPALLPQSGFLSLLYSIGSKPLSIWGSEGRPSSRAASLRCQSHSKPVEGCATPCRCALGPGTQRAPVPCPSPPPAVENGHIKRVMDEDIQSSVLEVAGANVSTAYITCPADPAKTLGIKLPFLVMIVKNLNKYFTFEVQVRAGRGGCTSTRGRRAALQLRRPAPAQLSSPSSCLCVPCPKGEHLPPSGRRAGAGRQECAPPLPRLQLPGMCVCVWWWWCGRGGGG